MTITHDQAEEARKGLERLARATVPTTTQTIQTLSETLRAYIAQNREAQNRKAVAATSGYMQVPTEPSPIKSPHSAGVFPKEPK